MLPSQNTLITGGTFTTHNLNVEHRIGTVKGGFERLQEAVAPGAFHNSGERFDPPKCHPNTRLAILKRLMDWILRQDPDTRDALVMWLYGPAGAGKSAIIQTLAEACHSDKRLLASFFFSRGDPLRGTARALVATIAYQLALSLPERVREEIVLAVEHDPLIFTRSLETQFTALIVQPVKVLAESGFFINADAPRLIIIDGLDECDKPPVQCSIIRAIFQSLRRQSLPLLFLVGSRPETDISFSFNSPFATSILARLGLDDSYRPSDDILLFLNDKFEEIKQTHRLRNYIPTTWPTDEVVEILVQKSSGQFIYASTVVDFVSSSRHRPTDRLDIILGIRPTDGETPFAELDALYTHIFSGVEDMTSVQRIIGRLILGDPDAHFWIFVTRDDLDFFLSLKPGDMSLILSDLGSLISLDEWGGSIQPRILHASLQDFFLDPSRSKDLYISPAERHTEYALLCFQHFNKYNIDHAMQYQAIRYRLFYHCAHALVTQELRHNVLQLSIESLVGESALYYSQIFVWIPAFFSFLHSLPWDTDKYFYREQLKSLDQFFMSHLDAYYSNPFLLLVVAVSQTKDYGRWNTGAINSFSFPKACKAIDSRRLCIADLFRIHFTPSVPTYQDFLINLLRDPLRAGKYFLDGAKYASAAICALTHLCNYWSHPLPAVHSDPDKRIRKCAPRRWREKWGRNSVLFIVRLKHKLGPGRHRCSGMIKSTYGHWEASGREESFFNLRKNPWLKEDRARGVFRFALFNLPYILKRAEKSREVFDFARQAQFGRRAKSYPKSTRLAKKAIEEYLARFSNDV